MISSTIHGFWLCPRRRPAGVGVGHVRFAGGGTPARAPRMSESMTIDSANDGAMQSVRGIKGIDTVMLQNLEAVLRMQAPPPPPEDGGGGGGVRAAAALLTMENDEPPEPEKRATAGKNSRNLNWRDRNAEHATRRHCSSRRRLGRDRPRRRRRENPEAAKPEAQDLASSTAMVTERYNRNAAALYNQVLQFAQAAPDKLTPADLSSEPSTRELGGGPGDAGSVAG